MNAPAGHQGAALDRPGLITFDVGGTLAFIDGESHTDRVRRASPLPSEEVDRILRDELRLKTLASAEELTDGRLHEICLRLRIAVREFPFGARPPAPYRLYRPAAAAVAAAAAHLPVAILTNTSVFADPALDPVREGLGPHLSGAHISWKMGAAKPHSRAFLLAAARHGLAPDRTIHIGDSWSTDVVPALRLGARAVWINRDRAMVPGPEPVPAGRLLVAQDVAHAVDQVIARWLTPKQALRRR